MYDVGINIVAEGYLRSKQPLFERLASLVVFKLSLQVISE